MSSILAHPQYRFRYLDPRFCKSCGGDTLPTKDTHLGRLCTDCRRLCDHPECRDWLLGMSVTVNGQHLHPGCAEELYG